MVLMQPCQFLTQCVLFKNIACKDEKAFSIQWKHSSADGIEKSCELHSRSLKIDPVAFNVGLFSL